MLGRCVIMAGQNCAITAGFGDRASFVDCAIFFAQLHSLRNMCSEFRIAEVALFGDIGLEQIKIAELALARRVIHQADYADSVLWAELGHFIKQRRRTDLGSQVKEVADPKMPCGTHGQQIICQTTGIFRIGTISGFERSHSQRIKHGGYAGRGQFGIMRQQRRKMRPSNRWSRLDMTFKVVGMQLDQAGQNEATAAIQRASRDMVAFGYLCDHAV